MNILAISPHPDDIEFSISGILLKIKKKVEDVKLTIAYNTKYDLIETNHESITKETRKNEAMVACRLLDASYAEFSIDNSLEKTASLLLEVKPDIVFVPYPKDYNMIHQETTNHIIRAIETARTLNAGNDNIVRQLLYYEAYSSIDFSPEYVINVTETYAEAQRVFLCHKVGISILQSLPYKFQILHKLRGLDCAMPYGEGIIRDGSGQYNWTNNTSSFFALMYKLSYVES